VDGTPNGLVAVVQGFRGPYFSYHQVVLVMEAVSHLHKLRRGNMKSHVVMQWSDAHASNWLCCRFSPEDADPVPVCAVCSNASRSISARRDLGRTGTTTPRTAGRIPSAVVSGSNV
jgi:hypothetical protein